MIRNIYKKFTKSTYLVYGGGILNPPKKKGKGEYMRDYGLTDEQVEMEIARLTESSDVKLARMEQRIKYRRRQYLYQLRSFEKRGKELAEKGVTIEALLEEEAEMKKAGSNDAV